MPLTPSHRSAAEAFARQLAGWGPTLAFNESDVLEDLTTLTAAFPDADGYERALRETLRQLNVVAANAPGRAMLGRLTGWRRHAYLNDRRARGTPADLRIVYRMTSDGDLELFGFGHRRLPDDVYRRLRDRPLPP